MRPLAIRAVVVALFCLSELLGQSMRVKAGPDPYTSVAASRGSSKARAKSAGNKSAGKTDGQAKALAKAGYENLGPFAFGTDQTTGVIEELLGTEPLMWIETRHFRIGCALPPLKVKGREDWRPEWTKLVKAELVELRKLLPKIKKKPKVLDPWLRAHLYAYRLEKLYSEVLDVLGVTDDWFTDRSGNPADSKTWRGLGPYGGMPEKFTVLILRSAASHGRYLSAYHGMQMSEPMRVHDNKFGCLYWGCSLESANGLLANDLALYANLAFNISHNIYTGFRAFGHDLPPWLATGLGHWHARRVSPRYPVYDRRDDRDKDERSAFWQWDYRVYGLVVNEVFENCAPFCERPQASQFGIEQHMQAWALVDYLLHSHKPEMAKFLYALKDPFHGRLRMPTAEDLINRQRDALQNAFGCEHSELDAKWRKHVLANKPRGKRRRR